MLIESMKREVREGEAGWSEREREAACLRWRW